LGVVCSHEEKVNLSQVVLKHVSFYTTIHDLKVKIYTVFILDTGDLDLFMVM